MPAEIWAKFMTKAHEGVPVAQLPGTEIVPYLLAQPAPGGEGAPWGFAAASPDEQVANEQRMRNWIFRDNDGAQPQPAQVERRGFFRRLFGG